MGGEPRESGGHDKASKFFAMVLGNRDVVESSEGVDVDLQDRPSR